MQPPPATTRNLRVFGLGFTLILLLAGLAGHYKWGLSTGWIVTFFALSGLFLILDLAAPIVIKPIYLAAMFAATPIGIGMTLVLMSVLYFVVLPVFSLVRLADPLRLRRSRDPNASYWEPHRNSEPTIERFSRPF